MLYDRIITISTAGNRHAQNWPAQKLLLSELYDKLKIPVRSTETLAEYLSLKKSQQDNLKDVGGFVGGELRGGTRRANTITGRDIIVLDLDNIPPGGTDDILRRLEGLGCGYCVYSTRKHQPQAPRLRVVLPLDRTVDADEFEPAARKTAQYIQPEMTYFDKTTFQASRLMYWPSVSADSDYVYAAADRPMLSADGLLGTYTDWHDMSLWPQCPGAEQSYQSLVKKQADPTAKSGIVGAFCKTYNVYQVMEKFIPGEYESCEHMKDRYTYTGGSTYGGAVIYDNGNFLYSHHATDPAGGKLCNAFDLVRLHKYGTMDDNAKPDTPANKLPSFIAMKELAVADKNVAVLMNKERHDEAVKDFNGASAEDDINWMNGLKVNSNGAFLKTIENALMILENDPLLKGKIATDDFSHKGVVLDTLPWDQNRKGRRVWEDNDESGIRMYMEKIYGITGKEKITDALSLCGRNHAFDDVKNYLEPLVWDGVKRLDRLFIDYLGADDNAYVRAATRKAFTAAVARTYKPGTKFDNMIVLTGKQGIGKSTILRKMGRYQWFTDGINTFDGKELCELIQGMWLVEISELEAFKKSEVNRVKQVLSQEIDRFRAAYGRHVQDCPRRCIFFGTSNNSEYLRDLTGNRRFWPIDTGINEPVKSVFQDLDGEIDQIWAEAKQLYQQNEPLYLPPELDETARAEQEAHREQSAREGLIREYLERKVPKNWNKMTFEQRMMYWSRNTVQTDAEPLVERDRICALEIWREVLGGAPKDMKYADAAEINGIINKLGGWEKQKNAVRFSESYGVQKGFLLKK